jgi:hypothetical protein
VQESRMHGTSLGGSILGDWAVSTRRHEPSPGLDPIGLLSLGPKTYRFRKTRGASIPRPMARRVVFLARPSGELSIRFSEGIDPEEELAEILRRNPNRLLAHLTFGDQGGENGYAVVGSGEGLGLGLAPMFHVAWGINVPPIVQKPGPAATPR